MEHAVLLSALQTCPPAWIWSNSTQSCLALFSGLVDDQVARATASHGIRLHIMSFIFLFKRIWFCDTLRQSPNTESWRQQQKDNLYCWESLHPVNPKSQQHSLCSIFANCPNVITGRYWKHVQGPISPLCVEWSGSTTPGLHQFRNAPGNFQFHVDMRLWKSNSDVDRAMKIDTETERTKATCRVYLSRLLSKDWCSTASWGYLAKCQNKMPTTLLDDRSSFQAAIKVSAYLMPFPVLIPCQPELHPNFEICQHRAEKNNSPNSPNLWEDPLKVHMKLGKWRKCWAIRIRTQPLQSRWPNCLISRQRLPLVWLVLQSLAGE